MCADSVLPRSTRGWTRAYRLRFVLPDSRFWQPRIGENKERGKSRARVKPFRVVRPDALLHSALYRFQSRAYSFASKGLGFPNTVQFPVRLLPERLTPSRKLSRPSLHPQAGQDVPVVICCSRFALLNSEKWEKQGANACCGARKAAPVAKARRAASLSPLCDLITGSLPKLKNPRDESSTQYTTWCLRFAFPVFRGSGTKNGETK